MESNCVDSLQLDVLSNIHLHKYGRKPLNRCLWELQLLHLFRNILADMDSPSLTSFHNHCKQSSCYCMSLGRRIPGFEEMSESETRISRLLHVKCKDMKELRQEERRTTLRQGIAPSTKGTSAIHMIGAFYQFLPRN